MTVTLPESTVLEHGLTAALRARSTSSAVITAEETLTYAELADRVDEVARQLGTARRLVSVEARNTVPGLVGYLGALAADCPVLLVPPGAGGERLAASYDADVTLRDDGSHLEIYERRGQTAHDLHPELALLLSTSGSTGSPKLVRLSRRNLLSNAAAIVQALGIRDTDRAVTTLPLHYCYGLSVVHSHLLHGAAVVLTELSVLDDGFWDLFRRSGATTLPTVPYTVELLDRVGFLQMPLPTLRSVTQAGGRLAPERVRAYAVAGARRGWDLHVMYGQTEATARMSVLPPRLAATHPGSIGEPVPGGSFTLEHVDGQPPDVGELVYEGDNVMLGYALTSADLALGRTVDRLHTGDLARRTSDGLFEVVGRRARFVKLFGLRLDQGHLEERLRATGVSAVVEPVSDSHLGVLVEVPADAQAVRDDVAAAAGLPRHTVVVRVVHRLPRTAAGKVDAAAARALLSEQPVTEQPAMPPLGDVQALFEELLGAPVSGDDTFVGLGGDSLSYVEMSLRLQEALGTLPPDWPTRSVAQLAGSRTTIGAGPTRPRTDSSIILRAVAILLIVGTHADAIDVPGGAHLLLLVAGYNLARFPLAAEDGRVRRLLGSTRRTALPAVAWIAGAVVVTGDYGWPNVLLLNAVLGPDRWDDRWSFWFLEALVALLLLVTALLAVRPLSRWERRHPLPAPLVLVALGLTVRFDLVTVPTGPDQRSAAPALLWLFALGWAAAVARTRAQRLLVAGLGAAAVLGWFGDSQRDLVVLTGLLVLLALPRVACPRAVTAVCGVLASSSLYVYVTHFQVYPHWNEQCPLLAAAASFAVGIAYWRLWEALARRVGRRAGWGGAVTAARRRIASGRTAAPCAAQR